MTPQKINIAIVGFGNIGSYFYKTLIENKGGANDIWKVEKKSSKKKVVKTENVPSEKEVAINTGIAKIDISSTEFKKLVEKITKKNMFRSYPNINDIPK